jgi:copper chaperone/Cu+-exporting ATPase
MTIEGMSCGGCVSAVRTVLGRLPGTGQAHVEIGSAVVEYDGDLASLEAMRKAVEKAGFTVTATTPE